MLEGLFAHPAGYCHTDTAQEWIVSYCATIEFFRSLLEQYPAGSLGRSYWEYCRKNGFALPGEKGGAPEPILFHDCAHLLSGYGTAPEEEVQVACFSAGFQRRDPFLFVFFVLLQFHVGIRMTPITAARTGYFDPEKALIAMRRGAAMNVDLNHGWDYWPVMNEQVEELRRRYNILPIEAFRTGTESESEQVRRQSDYLSVYKL